MSNVSQAQLAQQNPATIIKKRGFPHTLLITAFGLHLTPLSGTVLGL